MLKLLAWQTLYVKTVYFIYFYVKIFIIDNYIQIQMDIVKNELVVMLQALREKLTVKNFIIYLVEGLAVAIAAYVIPNRKTKLAEVMVIASIASVSFFLLDVFSEAVGTGSRLGAGLGIGYNLVNGLAPLPM
jgi:hypothetical protein